MLLVVLVLLPVTRVARYPAQPSGLERADPPPVTLLGAFLLRLRGSNFFNSTYTYDLNKE